MRFTVNMECTPEEARSFFGLPDVQPLQAAVMQQLQEQMLGTIRAMEPEALMKQWTPQGMAPPAAMMSGMQVFDNFQKMLWSQMGAPTGDASKNK